MRDAGRARCCTTALLSGLHSPVHCIDSSPASLTNFARPSIPTYLPTYFACMDSYLASSTNFARPSFHTYVACMDSYLPSLTCLARHGPPTYHPSLTS